VSGLGSGVASPASGVSRRVEPEGAAAEQACDLGEGQRDHPGVGRRLARPGRCRGLGIAAVAEHGGGDGADRQGGYDQHEVTGDRGIQPCLALVQAEGGREPGTKNRLIGPSQRVRFTRPRPEYPICQVGRNLDFSRSDLLLLPYEPS
jgi:hypothetical protein